MEQRDEMFNEMPSDENKIVVAKYISQFQAAKGKCKSIQQFYVEQGSLALFGIILTLRKKSKDIK